MLSRSVTRQQATKQKIPRTKRRGGPKLRKFRQFAAAPEPIISPDEEVIITAAATKAASDAIGAEVSAMFGARAMSRQFGRLRGRGQGARARRQVANARRQKPSVCSAQARHVKPAARVRPRCLSSAA